MGQRFDAVIVGAGIAGLCAADQLARRGLGRLCVVDREPVCFAGASGQNAAIFRTLCPSEEDVRLSLRNAVLLDELFEHDRSGWLDPRGLWFLGEDASLTHLEERARQLGVTAQRTRQRGLWVPQDGVMDTHAILGRLRARLREGGVELKLNTEVVGIDSVGGEFRVLLQQEAPLSAEVVVIAAGDGSARLGPRGLEDFACYRRHLVLLRAPAPLPRQVVWVLGPDELYFRSESGGLLVSPCDEERCVGPPGPSSEVLSSLSARLERWAPAWQSAQVALSWAGRRCFRASRVPIAGPDPRVPGLFWLTALGGHGMSAGLAAGEVLASTVLGQPHPLRRSLALP